MTVREKTEILFRFEETQPAYDARYQDLGVWPLLRLRFLQAIGGEGGESDGGELAGPEIPKPVKDGDRGAGRGEQRRNRVEREIQEWIEAGAAKLRSGDDLYLIQSSQVVEVEGDQPFHRLFDSLIELTGTRKNSRFLYWSGGGSTIGPEDLRSPAIAFTQLFGKVRRMTRESPETDGGSSSGQAVTALVASWNGENPDATVDIELLLHDCQILLQLIGVFEKLLANRPRAVFLTCFYSLPALALAQACRSIGIPCIEMQHGQQGDWHSLYTHRADTVRSNRDLLPTHFWAWGKSSQDRMQRWWSPEVTVCLGGNPWISYRSGMANSVPNVHPTKSGKKICLISMQFAVLDEFVVETINRRSDVEWWFRLHPRNYRDRDSFRSRCETDFGRDIVWEIDRASTADLYDLFGKVDVHLTGWSTTAHEAIHFGVPTILIHPNGKSAMGDAIGAGVFGYAEDAESLSHLIDSPPFRRDGELLMRADRGELKVVFNQLLLQSDRVLLR